MKSPASLDDVCCQLKLAVLGTTHEQARAKYDPLPFRPSAAVASEIFAEAHVHACVDASQAQEIQTSPNSPR